MYSVGTFVVACNNMTFLSFFHSNCTSLLLHLPLPIPNFDVYVARSPLGKRNASIQVGSIPSGCKENALRQVSVVTEFCSGGDMFSRLCTIGPFPHALAQKTSANFAMEKVNSQS